MLSPGTQAATAPEAARRGRALIARLDSTGDVLLAGGAVRAVAAEARSVTMLVGPEQHAAVGTSAVSLFAPVMSAERWRPYGVPVVLLGDQHAACRGSGARDCAVPGDPCLGSITPEAVVDAVDRLARPPWTTSGRWPE